MKIYCVEDEEEIRNLIIYALTSVGYEVEGFSESAPFWDRIKDNQPDLILLDIMLPGEDGIAILKKLKASEKYENIPVIMSTAKGSEYDKVIGLDLGADDYLTKPFYMEELVARIYAILRTTGKLQTSNTLDFYDLHLDLSKRRVFYKNEEIELQNKQFNLLEYFLLNKGTILLKEQIYDRIWGIESDATIEIVEVYVSNLRKILSKFGYDKCIKTKRKVGYMFDDK